jgi:hypothetical protein
VAADVSIHISVRPYCETRVHNAYLLAASWKVVFNVLTGLKDGGLTDTDVRKHLKNRAPARDAYLLVIDTIEMLSNLAQQELSVAVVGSSKYAEPLVA